MFIPVPTVFKRKEAVWSKKTKTFLESIEEDAFAQETNCFGIVVVKGSCKLFTTTLCSRNTAPLNSLEVNLCKVIHLTKYVLPTANIRIVEEKSINQFLETKFQMNERFFKCIINT